jgi:hypothetical protein
LLLRACVRDSFRLLPREQLHRVTLGGRSFQKVKHQLQRLRGLNLNLAIVHRTKILT